MERLKDVEMMKLEHLTYQHGNLVSNADTAWYGQTISPEDRLKIMSPDEWEEVTLEFILSEKNTKNYVGIYKIAGAGDKGRDIAALYKKNLEDKEWDCYQCKHYKDRLTLAQIILELGKLCYYTYKKDWVMPRNYFLVTPLELGPTLLDALLEDEHKTIRAALLNNWNKKCNSLCQLDNKLIEYIKNFDFGIISYIPPKDLIESLLNSPWGAIRFGGGLPQRPPVGKVPELSIEQEKKLVYIQALLDAYNDYMKSNDINIENLRTKSPVLYNHLLRSRTAFHSAEALKRFSREFTPPTTFKELLGEIENGIIDIVDTPFITGYERVLKAVAQAKILPLDTSILKSRVTVCDREGMCHHLSNEKENIKWVKK